MLSSGKVGAGEVRVTLLGYKPPIENDKKF